MRDWVLQHRLRSVAVFLGGVFGQVNLTRFQEGLIAVNVVSGTMAPQHGLN